MCPVVAGAEETQTSLGMAQGRGDHGKMPGFCICPFSSLPLDKASREPADEGAARGGRKGSKAHRLWVCCTTGGCQVTAEGPHSGKLAELGQKL